VLISMANYEYCLYKRQREKANMKRVVEIMELRRVEKKEAERVKAEEMQKAKEFADRKAEEQKKNRWKFW
jgi:cytochrome c oxidase assembly protein subunit 20